MKPNIVIIGSALYGNQGAAAMLYASTQDLQAVYPDAKFTLLSLYPAADRRINRNERLVIHRAKPLYLGLVILPLVILWRLLPFLRGVLERNQAVEALARADVILDQGGITFSDGREVFLPYNVASMLPGIILGKRTIKCSQALGTFKHPLNRWSAKFILPRMHHIFARGEATGKHLAELGLKNYSVAADYSFRLQISGLDKQRVDGIFKAQGIKTRQLVGLSPSVVVEKKCQKAGIDYAALMTGFVEWLSADGHDVLILPHSVRQGNERHNNDMPLCRDIAAKARVSKGAVHIIEEDLSPAELRYAISRCQIMVASRFHAMVSALAGSVPNVVIGWSHKYQEVIDMFGAPTGAIGFQDLNLAELKKVFARTLKDRTVIKKQLAARLKDVMASARQNTEGAVSAIENKPIK